MAIRIAVIEQVKNKITAKIKLLEAKLPTGTEAKAKEAAIKTLGLDKLRPKLEAAYKAAKTAEAAQTELLDQAREIVGGHFYGASDLIKELDYRAPLIWAVTIKAEKAKLVADTPQMKEIATLTKLRENLEIKLELASSTKEVREALQAVLDQLGEE